MKPFYYKSSGFKTFETYFFGSDLVQEKDVRNLLDTQFSMVDCILIISNVGMGGTHILESFYSWLAYQKLNPVIAGAECLGNLMFQNRSTLDTILENKFVLVDDLHYYYSRARPCTIEYLEDKLTCFLTAGNKLFIKINPKEKPLKSYTFLKNFKVKKLYLNEVRPEVLLSIANRYLVEEKISSEHNLQTFISQRKFGSYREFENLFILDFWQTHLINL